MKKGEEGKESEEWLEMIFDMITKQIIDAVWNKARIVEGYDPNMIRKDACGAWIVRDKYNVTDNPYCWVIEHIYPLNRGGDDNILNLRPLHIINNMSKSGNYPSYIAAMTSEGDRNVRRPFVLQVNHELQRQLNALYEPHK